LAAARRLASGLHTRRIPGQQHAHRTALLIVLAASALRADDITFDPHITQQEFATFSRIVAQGIFATPVQPARVTGLLSFDVGFAATAVNVDTNASYWQRAVARSSDFTQSGYAVLPRLVVSKGFSVATVAGSYARISNTGVKTWGGSIDIPVVRGTAVTPELAIRGSYATVSGVDVLALKSYGLEAFLSKGFGPVMPYGAIGSMRSDSRGTIHLTGGTVPIPDVILTDKATLTRYTVGVRFSLLVPKLVVEATQAERRSYAAKISVGF
jgi:hypothetical protein